MMKRKGEVDNNLWRGTDGQASGNNWQMDFTSGTSIPAHVGFFNAGERVFIRGITASGTSTNTAWIVVSSSVVGSPVRVI
jgi:hypothetical protein